MSRHKLNEDTSDVVYVRRQVGFAALREFVMQRPSLRGEAMNMLLELTTHPGKLYPFWSERSSHDIFTDKVTRGAAINTVKRWIPDYEPMAGMIRDFALQLLRRLQSRPKGKEKEPQTNGDAGEDHDENMEDGQLPQEDILQTPYLPEQLELPAQKDQVLQHLELLFALSTRVPEFLDECVFALILQCFILIPEQGVCSLWRHGRECTRNDSTAHNAVDSRTRIIPHQTSGAAEDLPSWCRDIGSSRADHFHRDRAS